ncbi:hypothetical protein Enr13x_75170 [Stieleria neptunia]|uniref:DUF427 domain-containing protein n=1 Tax=Stieleria neptunia TaxID=2527979 RepID=A0A518I3G4_9BACT|nr:DUF427 domain-containing protein [Stieleria neptunia]QDV47606.1 hypothetical protein Enr13x_75170 [Stieleria neptunia]
MATAKWNGTIIARSDDTVVVEGNHYFPADSVDAARLRPSDHQTTCGWKGVAHYKSLEVDGKVNENAAWYYPDPKPQAENLRGRFAFWKGVVVDRGGGADQTPDGAECEIK